MTPADGWRGTSLGRLVTREGLYKALSPGGNPEFGMVMKVIRAVGLELHRAVAKG